ncbi:MAG: hypothetical protein K6E85_01010 [Lachnospiraceae bacterium]|nr:hypothetical protein [Lachnospiraceae bacterium]
MSEYMNGYSELENLYKQNAGCGIDEIFEKFEKLFIEAGESFRNGLITEEEFYISTDPGALFHVILQDQGISADGHTIFKYGDFVETYNEWKKSGRIVSKKWMFEAISSRFDIMKTMETIFRVIDVLKIPMAFFRGLNLDNEADYPPIFIEQDYSDNIHVFMIGNCTNISRLTLDEDPVGKEFILNIGFTTRITDEPYITTARIVIETAGKDRYTGKGIIKDFMAEEGKIEIEIRNDCEYYRFGRMSITRLQRLFRTYVLPIPVTKWVKWEKARLKKAYETEAEYKILRLPYLIGADEVRWHKQADGNVYRIY